MQIFQAGPNHGLSNERLRNCSHFGLNALDEALLKIRAISSVILFIFSVDGVRVSSVACNDKTSCISILSINLSLFFSDYLQRRGIQFELLSFKWQFSLFTFRDQLNRECPSEKMGSNCMTSK